MPVYQSAHHSCLPASSLAVPAKQSEFVTSVRKSYNFSADLPSVFFYSLIRCRGVNAGWVFIRVYHRFNHSMLSLLCRGRNDKASEIDLFEVEAASTEQKIEKEVAETILVKITHRSIQNNQGENGFSKKTTLRIK